MKIVAFMQNAWFPAGTAQRHIDAYHTNQAFHQRLLASTMSGGRLVRAFGPTWFASIWWDNATKIATTSSPGKAAYDPAHIQEVMEVQKPELVLTFGNEAQVGVANCPIKSIMETMHCHHPNARHKTQADLDAFAKKVREFVIHHDHIIRDTPSVGYEPVGKAVFVKPALKQGNLL